MRSAAAAGRTLVLAALAFCAGCGSDFAPPVLSTTGTPAQPLGQILDADVDLPNLFVQEAGARGLRLPIRFDLPDAGPGQHTATYTLGDATAAGGLMVDVRDAGSGRTDVTVSADRWTTGRIGPLQVGTVVFEMMLIGTPEDGGRRIRGESFESQTSLAGTFVAEGRHRFLVSLTDFSFAGRVAQVDLIRGRTVEVRGDLGPVSSDAVLRRTGRSVFVINRLTFDNIQRLDPLADFATAWQAGVGVGANPHDIVDVGNGSGYVSRFEPPFNDLAVLDLADGTVTGSIPLGPLAENPDGTPRADRLVEVDGAIFVALQDIDRTFSRFAEGKLAVIDPAQQAVVGTIPLGGKNPVDLQLTRDAGGNARLWVALAGIFPGLSPQELSGGIVEVDPVNRAVTRLALDDDTAGGNIAGLAMVSSNLGYVVVSDATFTNRVLAFDPATGTVRRTVFESIDLIAGLSVDGGGVLAIPDRNFQMPVLCLYQVPADPAESETPLGCGGLDLLPFSVEALD
ncbi:MAG: hypothetical protein ACE5IK_10110 [Acidobacteriota bacterium]